MRWLLLVVLCACSGEPGSGGDLPPEDAGELLPCEQHADCPGDDEGCGWCQAGECFVVGCESFPDAGAEPDAGEAPDAGPTAHGYPVTELGILDARGAECPEGGLGPDPCAALGVPCGVVVPPACSGLATLTCECPRAGANRQGVCLADFTCRCDRPNSTCGRTQENPRWFACGVVSLTDACGEPFDFDCGDCPEDYLCGAESACQPKCTPPGYIEFHCAEADRDCGPMERADSCGNMVTVSCGECAGGRTCQRSGNGWWTCLPAP